MQSERERVERPGMARVGLIRGILVILTAVAVGAFVVVQGLDDSGSESVAAGDVALGDGESAAGGGAAGDDPTANAATGTTVEGGAADATDDTTESSTDATTDPADGVVTDAASDPSETSAPDDAAAGPQAPADVMVLVLNGAGAKGIAGRGSAILQDAGYDVLAPRNADFLGASRVLFAEGYEEEANGVAQAFGVDPAAVVAALDPADKPISDTRDANIVVVVGEDGLINV